MTHQGINQSEQVIQSEYFLDDIPEDERAEQINLFCRNSNKEVAAFLRARGFILRGRELVRLNGSAKTVVKFCFPNAARRAVLEYYNEDSPEKHNINAKRFHEAMRDVASMIRNF